MPNVSDEFGPETLNRIEEAAIKLGERLGIPRENALVIAADRENISRVSRRIDRMQEKMERQVHAIADAWDAEHKTRPDLGRLLRKVAGFFVGEYDKLDKR
jgi:hypothetical protein